MQSKSRRTVSQSLHKPDAAEAILDALGDPTRRLILKRLADGPRPVVEIAHGLPVSRPAVSQHLRVLKDAGLVSDRPEGNKRIYTVDPAGLLELRRFLESFWGDALRRYVAVAEGKDTGS